MDIDEARLKPRYRPSASEYVAAELAEYAVSRAVNHVMHPIPMRGIPAIGIGCPGRIAGTDPLAHVLNLR